MMSSENKDQVHTRIGCRKSMVILSAIASVLLSVGISITSYSAAAAETIFSVIVVNGKRFLVEKYGMDNVSNLPIIIITENDLKFRIAYGFTKEEIMIPWLKKNNLYEDYQQLQEARLKAGASLPQETIKLSETQPQNKEKDQTLFLYDKCQDDPDNPAIKIESGKSSLDLDLESTAFAGKASALKHTGSTHIIFAKKRFQGNFRWYYQMVPFHCLDYFNDQAASVWGQ